MNLKSYSIIAFALIALAVTGCTSLAGSLLTFHVDRAAITNTAPQIVATTAATVTTDAAGLATTNVVTTYATNIVTTIIPAVGTYEPAPLAVASTQAIAAIPLPFAGLASIGLGWLLTAWAAMKNKKLNVALTTGIEAGRLILQTTPEGQKLDAKFKDALIQHQEVAGVLHAAANLVNTYTGNTVTTPA